MTVPSRVPLLWEDFDSWATRVEVLLPQVFNESVTNSLLRDRPEYVTADDLRWLAHLLPPGMNEPDDLRYEALRCLRSHFTHLIAYHGCRPVSIEGYRQLGVTPLDPASMHESLVKRVCGISASGPTEDQVRAACASADTTYRKGRVYFEASRAHLLDHCGHYLLYGSEYAVGILRSISFYPDHAQLLKRQGSPTLLTCEIPVDWLQQSTQEELAASLLSTYFRKKLEPRYAHPQPGGGFGFEIYRALPSNLIADIAYPEHIRDPIALSDA